MRSDAQNGKAQRSEPLPNALASTLEQAPAAAPELDLEEEGLQTSAEELQAITDATPALIAYVDSRCHYRFVNRQYALWFGRPREQIVGQHMREILGDDAFTRLQPHIMRAHAGEEVHFEMEVPYRDAGTRFIKAVYHPHHTEDGSVQGIYVLVIDISQSKVAEDALRQTEGRLNMAMEAGQMGAWEWMVTTGKVTWSASLEALHGLAPGTFGGTFEDVQREMHPDDRARVLAALQECLEKKTDYRIEYRIIKPRGAMAWIEARGKLFLDAEGNPERMAGLCMNVTARRVAEGALRRSERFNRTIIESSRECIQTLTLDGVLLWINRAGLEAVGETDRNRLIGDSWLEFWQGEDRQQAEAAVRTAAAGGTGTFVGKFTREHTTVWWDVLVSPILDGAGKPERLLAVSRDATERRKLEEVHARLAAVVEYSDDAIISKSLDGIVTTWNRGAERMFGYPASEMIGREITALIPPMCGHEEAQILAKIRRGEVVKTYESVRLRKDGTLIHVSLTISPIKDASGRIIGASKIARDITQRKLMDEERARLARVLEKSLNEVYIFDTEHFRFHYVNEGALRNLGYSMEAMCGMTPLDIKPDLTETQFRDMIAPLLRGEKEKLIFNSAHRRANGTLYPVEVHLQCSAHGEEDVFMAVILDVTERRKAEEERERLLASEQIARAKAEEAETRARFLAEASANLASTLDYESTLGNVVRAAVPGIADGCAVHMREADGTIRVVASAHFQPEKNQIAMQLQERYPDTADSPFGIPAVIRSGRPEFHEHIEDSMLISAARDSAHLEMLRQLGLKSVMIVPLIANQQVLGAITLVTTEPQRRFSAADLPFAEDLAARAAAAAENARLYSEVQHSNKAKDHFMAVLSHELRTPLNPVLMTVADLENDDTLSPAIREQISVVRRNVELEARLIDDLLDSTRIATGKLQLDRSVVDGGDLLRRALAIVEHEAAMKEIQITVNSSGTTFPVHGDPARLQQVFWNVVKNAVKFTPKGGWIRIDYETTPEKTFRVVVQDSGAGIEKTDLSKIFNAFEQGGVSITHRFGGLGLGLAISKSLVDLHEGKLTANSAGPGLGATFTVELPLTERKGETPAEGSADAAQGTLRILVVEDHEDTSAAMARLLTRRGYEVTVAASVKAALSLVETQPFDLLVSDLGLPDGTGFDLMQKIRETQALPGIALSGYGTDADIRLSAEAGFAAHLTKPIDMNHLVKTIQAITLQQNG